MTNAFADALYELEHSLGWLSHLYKELHEGKTRKGEVVTDIDEAWEEVQQRKVQAKAAAVAPSHRVHGREPTEWLHFALCAIDKAVEDMGGPLAGHPLMTTSVSHLERCYAALREMKELLREADNASIGAGSSPGAAAQASEGRSSEKTKMPKRKGAPVQYDPRKDRRLYDDWKSSDQKTLRDFARARNLPLDDVKAAIHRIEQRLSKSRQ